MELVLNRKYCLVSLTGHAIQFEKDVKTKVPACMVHEAMAIGAIPVEDLEAEPEEVKTVHELDPLKREGEIMSAFKIIVERAQRNDFSAAGRPHAKAVSKLVGYDVDNTERDRLWDKHVEASES